MRKITSLFLLLLIGLTSTLGAQTNDMGTQVTYPFELTDDPANPIIYGIKTPRNAENKEWWFTYDETDQMFSVAPFSTRNPYQFFYFMETGEIGNKHIQIFPLAAQGKAMCYTEIASGPEKIKVCSPENPRTEWELVYEYSSMLKGKFYGFKIPGKHPVTEKGDVHEDWYLNNHGGVAYKLGLWFHGPSSTNGAAFTFVPVDNADMHNALNLLASQYTTTLRAHEGQVGYPVNAADYANRIEQASKAATLPEKLKVLSIYEEASKDKNVNLPVAGKAYSFTNISKDGIKHYLQQVGENKIKWSKQSSEATTFVCQVVDAAQQKYTFVNNSGKYFAGFDSKNASQGFTSTYQSDLSDVSLEKMLASSNNNIKVGNRLLVGKMLMKGLLNNETVYLTVNSSNANGMVSVNCYMDGNLSSSFEIEDAQYANIANTKPGISASDFLATFSAPFPTLVPSGLTAYYGKNVDGNKVILTSIPEGEAIPANQGVMLASTVKGSYTMIPATTTPNADVTDQNNCLGHTAGAVRILDGSEYLLGKKNGVLAFYMANVGTKLAMNRAYLKGDRIASGMVTMYFENDLTGIEQLETEEENAPIYDLFGRQVTHPTPGGIYIRNGKKLIIK